MRLFFALWPDADTATRLASIAAQLNVLGPGRLVHSKNYHVTLAFLGEVADSRLPPVQRVGGSVQAPRCTIAFDALEYWPRSQVVVVTARKIPPGLLRLATQLHAATGLPAEQLRVHVTLARKIAQAPVLQAMSGVFWRAASFSLVRSETGGAESAYTVVDTWPLLDET
ncbi:MAG: RNA 2',3'-cyclic phosphodiesterase [Pseudomonadota bacterium]|nr:RNA 2',3'-cyclic phosphodiesterase [Pseudomonadota bacterium]